MANSTHNMTFSTIISDRSVSSLPLTRALRPSSARATVRRKKDHSPMRRERGSNQNCENSRSIFGFSVAAIKK